MNTGNRKVGAIAQHATQRIVLTTEDGERKSSLPTHGSGKFPAIYNFVDRLGQPDTRNQIFAVNLECLIEIIIRGAIVEIAAQLQLLVR